MGTEELDLRKLRLKRFRSSGPAAVCLGLLIMAGCGAGPESPPATPAPENSGAGNSASPTPQPSASEGAESACALEPAAATKTRLSWPGRIAFAMDGDVYTMNADGGKEQNLTEKAFGVSSIELDPAWSPDGKQLAFSSNRGEDFDIYVMDVKGGGVRQVTTSAGDEGLPRWSPDGRKLGFSIERDDASAIASVNVDGTDLTTLREGPEGGAIGLSDWAPDGSRILFAVDSSSGGGELDTYVMSADGSCAQQLTDTPGDDSGARWSPDGKQILFGSNRDEGGIYQMAADGTDQRRVATAPRELTGLDTFRPAWSPDGERIAWTGKYEGNLGTRIYVMKADGTGLTAIHDQLDTATVIDWQPVPS